MRYYDLDWFSKKLKGHAAFYGFDEMHLGHDRFILDQRLKFIIINFITSETNSINNQSISGFWDIFFKNIYKISDIQIKLQYSGIRIK